MFDRLLKNNSDEVPLAIDLESLSSFFIKYLHHLIWE